MLGERGSGDKGKLLSPYNTFSLLAIGILTVPTTVCVCKGIDGGLLLAYMLLVGSILGINLQGLLNKR